MPNEHERDEKKIASDSVNKDNASFTRRSFIGGALAGAAGMGLTAAHAEKPATTEPKMPIWSGDLRTAPKPQACIPQTAKPNGLNLIVIVADTFRVDHLGCYGNTRVKTPHLDALAAQSVVFTNANAEGLPTIPCRRVYHTGKSVLPEAKWQPLSASDITFAEVLGKPSVMRHLSFASPA